jgi:hypothetical protein
MIGDMAGEEFPCFLDLFLLLFFPIVSPYEVQVNLKVSSSSIKLLWLVEVKSTKFYFGCTVWQIDVFGQVSCAWLAGAMQLQAFS